MKSESRELKTNRPTEKSQRRTQMAQTQNESTGPLGGAFGGSGFEAILPIAKEVWGAQLKTAQVLFDSTAKLSQTMADFYQTQATEGLKLTQACVATSKTVVEEVRRQATTIAEKAARS
jgi:hypothetical protein